MYQMFQKCSILLCCIKTALHQRKSFAEHLRHLHAFAFFSLTSFRIGFNSCIGSRVCTVHSAVGLKLTALRNSIKSLNHIGQCHVWYSDTALTLAGPFDALMQQKKGLQIKLKTQREQLPKSTIVFHSKPGRVSCVLQYKMRLPI